MPFLEEIIAMVYLLPVMIFQEGYKMFKEHMHDHDLWNYVPYFLLFTLVFFLIVFLSLGYKY